MASPPLVPLSTGARALDAAVLKDLEWIRAFRDGDRRAGDLLARRYYDRVRNVCMRYVKCPEEAADLTQDIFMKILGERKVFAYRGRSKFWTWLYRITVNACKTWIVKRRRSPLRPCPAWLPDFDAQDARLAPVATPEEDVLRGQEHVLLRSLLAVLPPRYREPLRLVCLEDYSYLEAAGRLRLSARTLGVQLMRGRRHLVELGRRHYRA